jgi:hypothetical protein
MHCGLVEKARSMMVVCDCHKKSDANLMHKACLEALLAQHDADHALCCSVCEQPYRVHVTYQFRLLWSRVLSCRAVGHCFEFFVVLFMVVCGGLAIFVFERDRKKNGERDDVVGRYIVYVLFAAVLVLVPLTLRRVAQRWTKANADAVVQIV